MESQAIPETQDDLGPTLRENSSNATLIQIIRTTAQIAGVPLTHVSEIDLEKALTF
jgi:hypothetical protein